MADLIKISVKDFNRDLLSQQMDAVTPSLLGGGLLWRGFERLNQRIYTPSTVHGGTAGELVFRYDPDLTAPREAQLDAVLAAHDSTQLSTSQQNRARDEIDRQNFVDTFNDWLTLTDAQKLNRTRELFRVVARLVDSRTDI